jgi:hypothetical protein
MHTQKNKKKNILHTTYTMPQRETVAGDATSKFSTSNMSEMVGVKRIRFLFGRHSVLLSSNTVFRDSTIKKKIQKMRII